MALNGDYYEMISLKDILGMISEGSLLLGDKFQNWEVVVCCDIRAKEGRMVVSKSLSRLEEAALGPDS